MRACLTGATGCVGEALARRLLRDGVSVRVLVEVQERTREIEKAGVELASVNLKDRDSIEKALDDVDFLYHLAAVELEATQNVFEACIRKGVPHVLCLSSIAVYGLTAKGEAVDELTPWDIDLDDRDPETRATREREEYASSIGSKTKLAVTVIRAGIVYGPTKPLPEGPLGYRAAVGRILLFGRREQHFPLTYTDNLADAMALLRTPRGLRIFIVIDDEHLTLGQYHAVRQEVEGAPAVFLPTWLLLAWTIVAMIVVWFLSYGSPVWNMWRRARRQLQDRRFDTRRIHEETAWAPEVSLREGIRQRVQYAAANDLPY
jgi:nucleoside-diphosphate-sugar epimerase